MKTKPITRPKSQVHHPDVRYTAGVHLAIPMYGIVHSLTIHLRRTLSVGQRWRVLDRAGIDCTTAEHLTQKTPGKYVRQNSLRDQPFRYALTIFFPLFFASGTFMKPNLRFCLWTLSRTLHHWKHCEQTGKCFIMYNLRCSL